MQHFIKFTAILAVVLGVMLIADSKSASAQFPVTTYYAPQPVVGYAPVRYGLFGLRTAYAPVVTYGAPRAVTSYYVPSAPVTTYYAPSVPTTTYYAPAPRVRTYYVPRTTYYVAPTRVVAPAPVVTYYPGTVIIGN